MHRNFFQDMHDQIVWLSLIVLMLISLTATNGEITTVTVTSDPRPTILFTDFCFWSTGRVTVTLSNVSVVTTSATPTNMSRLSFYLVGMDVLIYYLTVVALEDGKTCIAESPHILPKAFDHPIARFDELSPESSLNKTISAPTYNNYGIYFTNCEPNVSVTMHVVIETYNVNEDGSKNYLGVGESIIPMVFFLFALFYVPFIATWVYECYKNKAFVNKIHVVMAILLLVKLLNLLCAAEDKHYIKVTGTPHGWDLMFYVFYSIRALLLFMVIMLLGFGWSFVRPFLQENDKKLLAIGISLQVLANIAYIFVDESKPSAKNYLFWNVASCTLDVVGFGVVIVPVILSIRSLKDNAEADGTAARTLERMKRFRNFYGFVSMYWLMTRNIKYMPMGGDFCGAAWETDTFVETITLIFYIGMFYLFRPMEQNEYFVLEDIDEEVSLAIIRRDFEDI